MIYQLYEMGQASLKSTRLVAGFYRATLQNSMNPISRTVNGNLTSAWLEVFEDITKKYGKPNWNPATMEKRSARLKPSIEFQLPFCDLISFKRHGEQIETGVQKVLLVAPLSGHFATLLRDTITELAKDFDVYVTDWKDARIIPLNEGSFGFSDYVDYTRIFMRWLGRGCHVIAVCQPGPAVLTATALIEQNNEDWMPSTITLMGSPIDTRKNPTRLNKFAQSHSKGWFESNLITTVPYPHKGFLRRVYPGFFQLSGFMNMNLSRHLSAHKELYESLVSGDEKSVENHRAFYGEYLAVMDLPAEYYLETLEIVFQDHLLSENRLELRGRKIDLAFIRNCALMTIEGEQDDISGIGQTRAAHELCYNLPVDRRYDCIQADVGHYGLFSGSRWRSEIAPMVKDFMKSNAF